ncbi:MAG TPA: hypothetical protein VG537_08510 [Candidatus Kapabacteria bacterium]|jgi:hypothetical protein|nr:hypothetical protein [Candidatus Kapabacteria bacterium]
MLPRFISFLLLLALATACSQKPAGKSSQRAASFDSTKVPKSISQVLATRTPEWMKIPGVIGTGETKKDDAPAIMIMVDTLTESLRRTLPSKVEGYSIVIEQTGKVIPLNR